MLLPVAPLLQVTDLIQEGSIKVHIGKNALILKRDLIQLCIDDPKSLNALFDREDILSQINCLSEEFCEAGKTLEIKYKNSRVLKLGATADSLMLRLVGRRRTTMDKNLHTFEV